MLPVKIGCLVGWAAISHCGAKSQDSYAMRDIARRLLLRLSPVQQKLSLLHQCIEHVHGLVVGKWDVLISL